MSPKSAVDETSSSKTLLPMAMRLYWNANGETNLLQWIDDLNQAAEAEFGIYAQCIQTGTIPHEWTAKFLRPYDYDEMDDFDRQKLKLRMIDYKKVQSGFRFEQPKVASFILNNCTESSIKRCKNEYKSDFEKAQQRYRQQHPRFAEESSHISGESRQHGGDSMQSQRPLTLCGSHPKHYQSSSYDGITY